MHQLGLMGLTYLYADIAQFDLWVWVWYSYPNIHASLWLPFPHALPVPIARMFHQKCKSKTPSASQVHAASDRTCSAWRSNLCFASCLICSAQNFVRNVATTVIRLHWYKLQCTSFTLYFKTCAFYSCFVVLWFGEIWSIIPSLSGILHCLWGNHTIINIATTKNMNKRFTCIKLEVYIQYKTVTLFLGVYCT